MTIIIPIKNIRKWTSEQELKDFCEHIISHSERYFASRVFEAKEILKNLK